MKKKATLTYAAVQAGFWMSYCAALSYAAVFLQALGYSNASLGLVIAGGSLLGAFSGTFLSARIDRSEHVSAQKLCPVLLLLQLSALLIICFITRKGALSYAVYVLYICFTISLNSMYLKLHTDASFMGVEPDYGFARGMGSLAFVVASVLFGILVERFSVRILPKAAILICLWQFAAFFLFVRGLPEMRSSVKAEKEQSSSLLRFARDNRRFCVLLLGTVFIFFAHNTVGIFLINVARNVGGNEKTMGFLNGFMAAVEIPVIMFFTPLFGKRSTASLLKLSFIFFSLKALGFALAASVPQLAAAFVLQAPSFAIYAAAIVRYVSRAVPYKDSAKAQSLAFTMTTLGNVLANIIGGRLYDSTSVRTTLWIAFAVCVAGTLIALSGLEKEKG